MRRQVGARANPLSLETQLDRSGARLGDRNRRDFHQPDRVLRFAGATGAGLAAKQRPHLPFVALAAVQLGALDEGVRLAVPNEATARRAAKALWVEFVVSGDHDWTSNDLFGQQMF
jgi:hypothetical protein